MADRHLVVSERSRPLCAVPRIMIGSKPIDGGHYIFDAVERAAFLAVEPDAARFLRPFVGAEEYINGGERWILALGNVSPAELRAMPAVMDRIAAVRQVREASPSPQTLRLATTPTRFHVTVIPDRSFLVVPKVSSEHREYVPIGWMEPPTVPSDLVFVLQTDDLWHFGILTSRMHMAWLRHIGGRLKSDYRYSAGIVYNAFPSPPASNTLQARIRRLAQVVLDARARFPDATLADLYDADAMPPELHRAHRALDTAVDRLYSAAVFSSDRARVEHLFGLYERLVAPLAAAAEQRRPRRQRVRAGAL